MSEATKILDQQRAENIAHFKELFAMQAELLAVMVKCHNPARGRDLTEIMEPTQEIHQSIFREIENYLIEPVGGHTLDLSVVDQAAS